MHQTKKISLKRDISQTNIISFRRANALLKTEIKIRKREATISFTSTIQSSTPTSTIWNNIRRFCGLNQCRQIHCVNNTTNTQEIANQFAQHWSYLATDYYFHLQLRFLKLKPIIINHSPSTSATQT